MQIKTLVPIFAACTGLLSAAPADGGPQPAPTAFSGPGGEKSDRPWRDKIKENLPPEIRERFEAAREKAMQDPKIQELKKKADSAGEEFRKAMRDAMMKADPGLADVLKERMKDKMKDGKPGEPPGFANLSEGDRQKLMAAREKAKDDPSVKAAEAKKSQAQTPEDKRTAMEEFHKAMKAALLKVDPSLAPILEQLKPPQGPPPPPRPEDPKGPPPPPQ